MNVRKRKVTNQSGVSLVEMLVVCGILLLLTSLSIPSLIKSKGFANESSATESLHTIVNAETIYAQTCGAIGYSSSLTVLGAGSGDCTGMNVLDATLSTTPFSKSGYVFTYLAGAAASDGKCYSYTIKADPASTQSGQRHFFVDQTGVIRQNLTVAASASDAPVQ